MGIKASGYGTMYAVRPGPVSPPMQLAKSAIQSLSGDNTVSNSEIPAHFPSGDHEWNALKPVIRDLYVVKNFPLRLVAQTMRAEHGFKATERQYKTRFSKWGWKKTDDARAVQSTKAGRQLTKGLSRLPRVVHDAQNTLHSRGARMLMHESPAASTVDTAIRAYRAYIISWAETDSRWHKPTKYQAVNITCKEFTLRNDLRMAVSYIGDNDFLEGGRFLRLSFLAIENMLLDDHIQSSWDLFIWCPLRLLSLPQSIADNVVQAYSRYLFQQALVYRKYHPICAIAHSLYDAANASGMSGVIAFVFQLVSVFYDAIVRLHGYVSVTAVTALSQYADFVGNQTLQRRVMNGLTSVAEQASFDLGEDHADALMLQSGALTHRGRLGIFDDTFLATAESMIPILTRRYKSYEDLEKHYWYDRNHDSWMYRNSHHQLAKYWIHHGDPNKAAQCFRAATSLDYDEPDEHWKAFAQVAERRLRELGLIEQAEDIAAQRRRLDMPPEVREALEKEEIMDLTTTPESLPVLGEENDDD